MTKRKRGISGGSKHNMIERGEDTNINTEADKIKNYVAALRMAAYLLAVMLVFSAVSFLCTVNAPVAPSPYNGAVNLTCLDFSNEVVTIQNTSFTMYPGVFYLPEDFALGKVAQTDVHYNTPGVPMSDFGTLRILLALPPGEGYAIAGKNVSYAQRLFIDGEECAPIGVIGVSIENVTPKTMRFMEGFGSTGDTTEIIIHYSAFVYGDGGGLYPFEIGLVRNVARNEQLRVFRITAVTAALITAMLFFFGLFLFFPKGRYLLWFALICLCVAMRGLLTSHKFIMLLFPNLDWYLAIRLEFILTGGIALFSALYLSGLFPRAVNRWAIRSFTIFCMLTMAFFCLMQPVVFSRFTGSFTWVYALFLSCLVLAVLIAALRKKLTSPLSGAEQILLLFGLGIYTSFSVFGIYAHQNSLSLWGLDYPQAGMIVFLFLNMLALVLGFARTDRELTEARRSEREMEETNQMLDSLNRVKSEFLGSISHELRTPLEVICGSAGLVRTHIERNILSEKTLKKLDSIEEEAMWVAQYADELLAVSLEEERQLTLTDTDAETLLMQAAQSCTSACGRNKNRIVIQTETRLISMRVNIAGIHRVLLNLILNANKHTKSGVIALSAKYDDEVGAVFTVSDDGDGIPCELLPGVFERGVSGDGSSGFGLAICKRIVKEHGGEISIESSAGAGTAVSFTLPCGRGGDGA